MAELDELEAENACESLQAFDSMPVMKSAPKAMAMAM